MSTQIIESGPVGYGKEQVGDPRRWFALPVLLTGAFLPILDFNVVNLALPAIRGDLLVYPLVEGRGAGWATWIVAMLIASPFALMAFVRFEARLAKRGGDPLVALHLLRNSAFAIGLVIALAFYMLSSFYLTFAVYLQNGLHETPLAAGLATLPFATGFFVSSLISSHVMQRLGVRALTLGFALQVLGFSVVMLAVSNIVPQCLTIGLICGGLGFGTVMPSVIKAVIGSIDPRHAGLASGIVISTFQIGAALGVAIIGGIFHGVLGTTTDSCGAHRLRETVESAGRSPRWI